MIYQHVLLSFINPLLSVWLCNFYVYKLWGCCCHEMFVKLPLQVFPVSPFGLTVRAPRKGHKQQFLGTTTHCTRLQYTRHAGQV